MEQKIYGNHQGFPIYDFFQNYSSNHQNWCPHLKINPLPPPSSLKHETHFYEMIPTKNTINNNLKSS